MGDISFLVAVVVVTALIFDFTNGFHDTANAMATSIATGALRPRVAVAISAVLNLVGAFLSVEVAKAISGGMVEEGLIGPDVVFAALVGAILWNLLTWLLGLPSSSSHALFGGLVGATLYAAGTQGVHFDVVAQKVLIPAVVSPVVAALAALLATRVTYRMVRGVDDRTVSRGFRMGQVATASLVSLAHGTNDAQKTMGIITLTLVSAGMLPGGSLPPFWVVLSAGLAIGLGTYMGGWRIIRTMGKGLTDIQSPQGFAAEASATAVILTSSHLGFSLSTTQVASGGIIGAGLGRSAREIRWSVAGRMVLAWGLTFPGAGLVGAVSAAIATRGDLGVAAVAALGVAGGLAIYLASRRKPITAGNVNDVPGETAADGAAPAEPLPGGDAVAAQAATAPATADPAGAVAGGSALLAMTATIPSPAPAPAPLAAAAAPAPASASAGTEPAAAGTGTTVSSS
ncbi:inorganic phosphate transporter [Allostreptomyces psammosilenae]|uniref:Phosphate transporter n=1 Tax=Allostreptomyces psammosilenae TaxID=1892865 RepID=A0A852ZVD9_9ACTN|nr:inorganic phosphate transporter [Allostreptomyces psammosilenae]NYI06346.1 PiT family inorganic phosphate transporter [Allostreptomyces psammosilenae]